MSDDRAILYSSGVAEFDRGIEVPGDGTRRVAVRVRQNELADLLASFEVRGPVRYASPPTWDGSGQPPTLTIDPHTALPSLLVQLVGAEMELGVGGSTHRGEMIGVHEESRGGAGDPWQERFVSLLVDGSIERLPLADVTGFRLLDETLQKDLDRALRNRLENLRPSSKTMRFELASTDGASQIARMRYTIPAAAWKISYRLRIVNSKIGLAAFAIVDNDGEEDWKDLRITVVTGEPISFATDLADARRPRRKVVKMIAQEALGAVEVEEGFESDFAVAGPVAAAPMARKARMRGQVPGAAMEAEVALEDAGDSAAFTEAAAREVGEFQVFEARDLVTIEKGQSAAIPLFELELGESRRVLHYKQSEHAERPWRAIDFVHDGDVALGRGVCTVTEDGVFAGTCIVPGIKPGGDALLPHALETGVRVRVDERGREERRTSFAIGGGYLVTNSELVRRVSYRVHNGREDKFVFLIDHELAMHDAEIEARLLRDSGETELAIESKLASGYRLRFDLRKREELSLEIVERAPTQSTVHISAEGQFHWFFDVFLAQETKIADRPELRDILTARRELESVRRDIEERRREHDRLQQRQDRLRKNVDALHRHEDADKWRGELSSSEERLFVLEETELPDLEARERATVERIEASIHALNLVING